MVAEADLTTGALGEPLDAQWRAIPDVNGFDPDTLDAVAADVRGLAGRVNAALPGSNQASVATKLPDILASVDRSVLVAQAGILLLLVQFGVLAAYAVILVAALLLERRRSETALLRSRGAGTGHLAAMAFGEALLVVVPAAIAAPWLAVLLVQAVRLNPAMEGVGLTAPLPGPTTFATAALGAVIALIALTIPTLLTGVSIAGVRASIGRQAGRTLPAAARAGPRPDRAGRDRDAPAPAVRRDAHPQRPRDARAWTRCWSPPRRSAWSAARCSRSGSCPASPSSRSGGWRARAASSPRWAAARSPDARSGTRAPRCS